MNYTTGDTLLQLINVGISFGDNIVLRDIYESIFDIKVPGFVEGQVVTVLGRSGIGKTQLFNMISGLLKPTTGQILVGQSQVEAVPGLVGYVFQSYPLFKHLTVLGNLKLVEKDNSKIDWYLNEFDLMQHKDKYPRYLSGGQRQRTSIVQQMLTSGHFLLLDEPFSGLDPLACDKLCMMITKIANMDEINTILISSHIIVDSLAVSDTVWMLGNQYTEQGDKIPGATIMYKEDLAANGMAWRADIRKDRQFQEFCVSTRELFKTM